MSYGVGLLATLVTGIYSLRRLDGLGESVRVAYEDREV
jgi:hypothetical protein